MNDSWRVGADLADVGRVVAELQDRMTNYLGRGAHDVALAVEELLANAVIHGRKLSGRDPRLLVTCDCGEGRLRVEVRDDGPPFNPLEAPMPDLDSPLDERPAGGLGVHLVLTLVDEVQYARQGGENVVALTHRVMMGPSPKVRRE